MGKLDYLEVLNFKSYKGKQIIGPFYRFTAVVGPNGAGKSNLMDAISFVLGIRSQHLRSTNVKDLVYRGLSESKDPEDSPTSAYVEAVYVCDNKDRLAFKRSITKAGSSEYFIDGKSVSYQEYKKVLEKENILVDARNFLVFQGDVEAIASQSPKDLTKLIEQVSGSIELKKEYDELKAAQESATQDSSYNFLKKRGMAAELKQYQEQKKEAEKFEQLRLEKRKIVSDQILWKLFHIEQNFLKTEEELEKDDAEVVSLTKKMQQDENNLHKSKIHQSQCLLELKKVELQLKNTQSDLEQKQPEVLTCNENLNHALAKEAKISENESKLRSTLSKQADSVESLENQLNDAKIAFKKHEDEAKRIQAQDLTTQDMEEYNKLTHQFTSSTFTTRQELEKLERPEKLLSDQVDTTQQNKNQLQYKMDQIQATISTQTEQFNSLNETSQQCQEDINQTQKELEATVSERLRLDQKEKEANEKLTRILNDLVQARVNEQASERETKLREGLETLKRVFSGVHGRLVDLIKPTQSKFETAVLTILAPNLDAVIVNQESTALECIKFLKDQRLGSAKFIPLDTVAVPPSQDRTRQVDGARLAIDVIQYDSTFERAIQYACGNALVCDSFQVAKRICFELGQEVKAVALDGTIIHKSGFITGGGAKIAGVTKATRRWEEKKTDELRQQRDILLAELNQIQRSKRRGNIEEGLRSKLQGLKENLVFLNEEKSKLERDLTAKRQELSFVQTQLDTTNDRLNELQIRLDSAREGSDKLRHKIFAEQDELFSNFTKRLGFVNIREYEKRLLQATRSITEKNIQFQAAISKLENQLEFETRRRDETQKKLDQLISSKQIVMAAKVEAQAAFDAINQACKKIRDLASQLTIKVDKAQEKYTQSSNEVQISQRELDNSIQALDAKYKIVTAKESILNKFNGERMLILRRCKLEEIELPLNLGDLDNFEDEGYSESLNIEKHIERIKSSQWSVEVDFSSLSQEQTANSSEELDREFESKLISITDEMNRMAPNLKAIDKMNEVQRRALETEKEFSQARNQALIAKARFTDVKLKRYQLFYNAFEHISREINEVYKDLTKNSTFPMGGTAYLSLENSEEPYLEGIKYHAMPPMKRFGDMEKLSGGEKSVAALALLFAIHSFHPAPFFVLDEVDAALDNDNVAKVARYLRNHGAPNYKTQFLVISLKPTLFEKAQSLVGVCRDQTRNSSKILTLDLEQYDSRR